MGGVFSYNLTNLKSPAYYHRRSDIDLPIKRQKKEDHKSIGIKERIYTYLGWQKKEIVKQDSWIDTAKRMGRISVPFLCLHQPFSYGISISMNSCRSLSLFSEMVQSIKEKEIKKSCVNLVKTSLAVISLAGTFFNFKIGHFFTTIIDILFSMKEYISHLLQGEYKESSKEILHLASSSIYLGIMLHGSLEMVLVSLILNGLVCFYEAALELQDKNYLEAIAKALLGSIRTYQVKNQISVIKRFNFLLTQEKLNTLFSKIIKGKDSKHLFASKLHNLSPQIQSKKVLLEDVNKNQYDFGSHFHGYGKGLVKGANICFKETDDEKNFSLEFKVNHVFRDKIQNLIADYGELKKEEIKEVLFLTDSSAKNIKIQKKPFSFEKKDVTGKVDSLDWDTTYDKQKGDIYKISLKGLGKIFVGASADYPNLYDRVTVKINKSKSLSETHELLAFLNLDDSIKESTEDDINKLKLGQLFRVFFPREATTKFERTEDFFSSSFEELKAEIFKKIPRIKNIYDEYFSKMEAKEILPGKLRYTISGLSKKAEEAGAQVLTASITGAYNSEERFDRIVSILKMGMISNETRDSNDMESNSLSASLDYGLGGADSVFTQLITKNQCERNEDLYDIVGYYSDLQMLFSLDVLETGTYQYLLGGHGYRLVKNKGRGYYSSRLSILEFIKEVQNSDDSWDTYANEVMIKERIDPSYIKGIVVPDEETSKNLLEHLRKHKIAEKNPSNNTETILGLPVDKFIRIGTKASTTLLA